MQIKVYKAATVKEAMQQVKAELGADAVILHTKKYREGGILGIGAKEVVEVTAALEDAPAAQKPRAKKKLDVVSRPDGSELPPVTPARTSQAMQQYRQAQPTAASAGKARSVSEAAAQAAEEKRAAQQRFDALVQSLAPQENTNPRIIKADARAEQTDIRAVEGDGPEAEKAGGEAQMADAKKIQDLQAELTQMKSLLAQVMAKEQPAGVRTLQDALKEQEVDEAILKDLAGAAAAGETLRDSLTEEAHAVLADYLKAHMTFANGIRLNQHGCRIVALIGPTGVGKTTTLAKIAARFVLEQGVDAALITADTYRISAVEQLKTYSDIIGLPLEIVYTPQELQTALHKFRQKDLVLIDTAGRSQHNEFQMKELVDFLAANPRIERHLVMSATTKNRDAADILEKFSVCEPDCIVFTKTDETASVGMILNLLYRKEIALSFLTNGQSVPDDIVPATPEALADLLLRE